MADIEAGYYILGTRAPFQTRRHLLQQLIAGRCPKVSLIALNRSKSKNITAKPADSLEEVLHKEFTIRHTKPGIWFAQE